MGHWSREDHLGNSPYLRPSRLRPVLTSSPTWSFLSEAGRPRRASTSWQSWSTCPTRWGLTWLSMFTTRLWGELSQQTEQALVQHADVAPYLSLLKGLALFKWSAISEGQSLLVTKSLHSWMVNGQTIPMMLNCVQECGFRQIRCKRKVRWQHLSWMKNVAFV